MNGAAALAPADVPDFVEPFEAWRVWRVVAGKDGFRLRSVVQPTLWPPGKPLVAECLRGSKLMRRLIGVGRHAGDAPDDRCACGIYAAGLPRIAQYLADARTPATRAVARVLGQVSLWGTVMECERGYRASHAYPLRIYVPADSGFRKEPGAAELAAELEVYGVDVELMTVRCSDAVMALEHVEQLPLRRFELP